LFTLYHLSKFIKKYYWHVKVVNVIQLNFLTSTSFVHTYNHVSLYLLFNPFVIMVSGILITKFEKTAGIKYVYIFSLF